MIGRLATEARKTTVKGVGMLRVGGEIKKGMDAIRAANLERDRLHFKALPQHGGKGDCWTPNDWMTALAGEIGEAANILKKVRRGDFMLIYAKPSLARELADALTYLDLLAEACGGIDLGAAFVTKFNAISDRIGCDVKIATGGRGDLEAEGGT